jgi:hypothetical protein
VPVQIALRIFNPSDGAQGVVVVVEDLAVIGSENIRCDIVALGDDDRCDPRPAQSSA